MLLDHPGIETQKEVIVVAGVNDINNDSESPEYFLAKAEKRVKLIQQYIQSRGASLTMVEPPLPTDVSIQRMVKVRAYDKLLARLSNSDEFPFRYLKTQNKGIHMDGFHPTVDGTKSLLTAIHGVVPIIENEKFIVSDRFYQGVEAAFKYGCLTCHEYLDLDNAFVCPKCLSPADPSPAEPDVRMDNSRPKHLSAESHPHKTPNKKAMIEVTQNGDGE